MEYGLCHGIVRGHEGMVGLPFEGNRKHISRCKCPGSPGWGYSCRLGYSFAFGVYRGQSQLGDIARSSCIDVCGKQTVIDPVSHTTPQSAESGHRHSAWPAQLQSSRRRIMPSLPNREVHRNCERSALPCSLLAGAPVRQMSIYRPWGTSPQRVRTLRCANQVSAQREQMWQVRGERKEK